MEIKRRLVAVRRPMSPAEVNRFVKELDSITTGDPEGAHADADAVLLRAVHPRIRKAYDRVVRRTRWWGTG